MRRDERYDEIGESFDLPEWRQPWPGTSYLVCATPRSGSGLLCNGLYSVRWGVPAEYFEPPHRNVLSRRWGSKDLEGYLRDLIRHRTNPQGVFGLKMHWHQLVRFVDDIERVRGTPRSGSSDPYLRMHETLCSLLPEIRYVYIFRGDVASQAVSFWMASHTNEWRAYTSAPERSSGIEYDLAEIRQCEAWIRQADAQWRAFFAAVGADPIEVEYGSLVERYAQTVQRVISEIGPEPVAVPAIPEPSIRSQTTWEKVRLTQRYRRERGAPAG